MSFGLLALRAGHVRLAAGEAVEEALAVDADEREAEAQRPSARPTRRRRSGGGGRCADRGSRTRGSASQVVRGATQVGRGPERAGRAWAAVRRLDAWTCSTPSPRPRRVCRRPRRTLRSPSGCARSPSTRSPGQGHLLVAGLAAAPPRRARGRRLAPRRADVGRPLGPAGHGQDDARLPHRRDVRPALRRAVRRHRGRQGRPARDRRRPTPARHRRRARPSCSSTRCTASPRRSRTRCCPASRTGGSRSSPRPPRTRPSRSTPRCCPGPCCSRCGRWTPRTSARSCAAP